MQLCSTLRSNAAPNARAALGGLADGWGVALYQSNGNIVGGEWTGQSQREHPDFLWVALEPMQGNGTRYMGNPNLDANEVCLLLGTVTNHIDRSRW